MRRFKSAAQAHRFLCLHGCVRNLFRVARHHLRANHHRLLRQRAFTDWKDCDVCLLKQEVLEAVSGHDSSGVVNLTTPPANTREPMNYRSLGPLRSAPRKREISPPTAHPLTLSGYEDSTGRPRQVIDLNGGRDRTRTCDLLRVKQAFLAKLLIIEAIFLQENALQTPKVRSWVGGWVGSLVLLSARIASGQSQASAQVQIPAAVYLEWPSSPRTAAQRNVTGDVDAVAITERQLVAGRPYTASRHP